MAENLGDDNWIAPTGVRSVMRLVLVLLLVGLTACMTEQASRVAGDHTPQPARHDEDADGWFLRSISEDGKTLEIEYTMSGVASGCEEEGESYAEESDDEVIVHAVKSVLDDRNAPCTEELAHVDATITLKVPLGDRLLLGCLQKYEREQYPEAASDKRGEAKLCRSTSRGKHDAPAGDY
jgi:hypothetical protein